MSKKIYIGIYATSFGLCLLTISALGAAFVFGSIQEDDDAAIAYAMRIGIYALLQLILVHTTYNFLLLARMWDAIQDGQTTITVGEAVGFCLIPFFNFYWIYRVWGSYSTEYNRYLDRYDLPVPPLVSKVFVAYPIVLLLTGILYAPLPILPIVFIAVISNVCDAVNSLNKAVGERRNQLQRNETSNELSARI